MQPKKELIVPKKIFLLKPTLVEILPFYEILEKDGRTRWMQRIRTFETRAAVSRDVLILDN